MTTTSTGSSSPCSSSGHLARTTRSRQTISHSEREKEINVPLSPAAASSGRDSFDAQHHHRHHYVSPIVASFPGLVGPALPFKYRPCRAIGRGAYSTVWALKDNSTGTTVVGKLSDLQKMSEANRAFACSEAANIHTCCHPNIIRLIETYEHHERLLHILEYADAGDLLSQVEARSPPSKPSSTPLYYQENEVLVILAQLSLAIKYIHDRRIMHRDLKTPNVMLTKSGLIKLGDFGFSRQYNESVSAEVGTTFCGTPYYLAPELWRRHAYSYKADIWSLGVIIYELLALKKPFPAHDLSDLMKRVLQQDSYDPLPTDRYSPALIDLTQRMLRVDPAERPSIRDILFSPIMQAKGLRLLKINVPRLRGIPDEVRRQLVSSVEEVQQEYAEARAANKA